ncbi:MAG: hypothetical protein KC502_12725 [Myxococcales bacterium]|nr:hypothetical protein [Myxococcales bacterium]
MRHRSSILNTQTRRLSVAQALLVVAAAASLVLSGCGSEGDAADKDAGKKVAKGLGKTLPGPCSTTQTSATGKIYKKILEYKWDAKGKPLEEKSGPTASDIGADTYTKKWTWNPDGTLANEFFETSGPEPNYDWTYTYDAKARKATRKGTQTGYGTEDCKYEYEASSKDYNLLCNFEYEEKDDEGNVTGTVKGTYSVQYIFGMGQITERHTDGKGGTPSQVTQRFDKDGNLIAIELDSTLRGYPEHVTAFKYNDKGQMVERTVDSDADGNPELSTKFTFDEWGNKLKAVFEVANVGVDRTWAYDYSCW